MPKLWAQVQAWTILNQDTKRYFAIHSTLFPRSCAVTKAQEFFHGTGTEIVDLGLFQVQALHQSVTLLPQGIDVRMM